MTALCRRSSSASPMVPSGRRRSEATPLPFVAAGKPERNRTAEVGARSLNPGSVALGEHAELVALRIGHHDPGRVSLADVDPGRPPNPSSRATSAAWSSGRRSVQAVLDPLGVGHLTEQQARHRVRVGPDLELASAIVDDDPPRDSTPPTAELCESRWLSMITCSIPVPGDAACRKPWPPIGHEGAGLEAAALHGYAGRVLLVGLRVSSLFGWSWANPLAALVIIAVAVREGREAWRGEGCACAATSLTHDPPMPGCSDDCCGWRPNAAPR